jgi:hypothetical protein
MAPTADDYLRTLETDERCRDCQVVKAGNIWLSPGGRLMVGDQAYEVQDAARKDLSNLARIPATYFEEIEPELRAFSFNCRFPRFLGTDEALNLTVSNDIGVQRVQQRRLRQIPASKVVDSMLDAVPEVRVSNDIRVIEYQRGRRFDIAVVAPTQQTEPKRGDVVCGGIHLTIEENGAVQVGPESFRLICLNGAMARICADGKHRLRRGQGENGDKTFLSTLRKFTQQAWRDWGHVKKGLEDLANKPLDRDDLAHIVASLRQSPFFISAQAARQVEKQLRRDVQALTFFDLYNALTSVGTHDTAVLPQYRYRLRLGAGQMARGSVGVCPECRRLMIGTEASQN